MGKTKQRVWTIKTLAAELGWSAHMIYIKAKDFPPSIAIGDRGSKIWGDDQLEAIRKIVGKNPGRGRKPKGGA